jgi:ornithine cyclodeaminase/alanine dehydrogenase-like protein (mu-crystallin family)
MLTITEQQVPHLLPMRMLIDRMHAMFEDLAAGLAHNQPRRRLQLPNGTMLHALGGSWCNYLAAKVYTTSPGHPPHFLVLLYDAVTGAPLAQIEANRLGQIRTGAASGLATQILSDPDASVVAVIGSGFQAAAQVEAVRAVRAIREVRVYSRSPQKREAFAQEQEAIAVSSAAEACDGADIVITATYAKDPVVEAGEIRAGAHVNAIGSNHPHRRELPAALLDSALVVVDDLDAARVEAGDLLLAWGSHWGQRVTTLAKLVQSGYAWSSRQTTVFKSVGLGVEDAVAAGMVYENYWDPGFHRHPIA